MGQQASRRLVIDADVARSAGESEHPISSACRQFLEAVLDVEHQVVMSDAILKEWRSHISRYTRRWRRRMYGRRLVLQIQVDQDESLRERIRGAVHANQRETVTEDAHLIEAAVASDRLISSQDERARRVFSSASTRVGELRVIVWVNPTRKDQDPVGWLRDGARTEVSRQLGS